MEEQTKLCQILQEQSTLKVELLLNMIGKCFYGQQKSIFSQYGVEVTHYYYYY
jgi:hypothetical protein